MRQASLLFASVCFALLSVIPADAQTVGVSAAVNQNARGIQPGAPVRTIVLGDNVVYNERIETDAVGLLQILLADGTAFTVGPNSAISIDRFVYDPAAGTAEVTASLTKGVFRFIGGKTSKTPGGATLNTPVGTIGIRGAMVTMGFDGETQESGSVTSHIDMNFGEEVTLDSPGGETQRIFKAGYSIIITRNADGSEKREVRRTPPGLANEIQGQLSGAPGTSGGASEQPTDPVVIVSGISTENSDRPPVENVPIPTARPSDNDEVDPSEDVTQEASNDLIRDEVIEEIAETNVNSPQEPDPEPPVTPTRTIWVRLATAGATYTTNGGVVIANPGSVGLVGGSPEEDRVASLSQAEGSSQASGDTNRGTLVLPVYSDNAFTVRTIASNGTASLGGVPLDGIVYTGVDGFAAYTLLRGDDGNPVYALTGTPTADTSVFNGSDIRVYSFSDDLLQGVDVPFMRAAALGTDYENASISDLYLVEGDGAGIAPTLLQSWLLIDGTGTGQRSGIGVNIAPLLADSSGAIGVNFGRRGSFRPDALDVSFAMGGATVTPAGPDEGTQFFGPNGQNFVLTADTGANDFFSDASVFGTPSGGRFATTHVLNLESETSISQFSADRGSTQNLISGGGRTIQGFAAGLVEVGASGGYAGVLATSSNAGVPFSMTFDGSQKSLGGAIAVADLNQTNQLDVVFGDGLGGNTQDGRSTYVDDDLFAAVNNNSMSRNTLTQTDSDGAAVEYRQVAASNPRTVLISGDANPLPNLLPDGQMCECTFLEWGWWSTQITARSPQNDQVRAGVHLGTWVAGDIASATQLQNIGIASASYQGSVVGNVSANSGSGLADYVASGTMSLQYSFTGNSGTMSIDDFDNRDFSGTINGSPNVLTGALSETTASTSLASGSFDGAFVNDGAVIAKGVIGNFDLSTAGGDWAAAGIVAGARP